MSDDFRAYVPQTDDHLLDLDSPWGRYAPNAPQSALIGLTRRTVLQRGDMRRLMSKLIVRLGSPLDIYFRDCGYRIDGRNNLIEWGLLTRPSYNGVELDFLSEVMRGGGVGLDIGCNVGLYALPLAQAGGAQSRVLAIDANPQMIARLTFNAQASGLAQVTPLHLAVGAHEAKVDLQIRSDDVAIVNVRESDAGDITMKPLRQIVQEAGLTRVDALKIDIEGHEDMALVPYLDEMPAQMHPRRIVIEKIGPAEDYPGCTAAFARHGYTLVTRTRNNSLYARD